MGKIVCAECDREISSISTHCPNCGCPTSVSMAKGGENSFLSGCFGRIVLIVIILIIVAFFVPKQQKSDSAISDSPEQTVVDDNLQEMSESNIQHSQPSESVEEFVESTVTESVDNSGDYIETSSEAVYDDRDIRKNSTEVSLSGLSDSVKLLH